jgi:glycine dehydrogenase subunit 1
VRFVPHSQDDVREMLAAVGAASVDELFAEIPAEVRLGRRLDLSAGVSESEVLAELEALASRDEPASRQISFLGAGIYDTYVPAVVDALVGRSEFLTSYTPYQPERSQGVLQAIFEYQTAICELTALDVSNASLYDGATALTEATLLAMAQTRRRGKVVCSQGVHPEYLQVLRTQTAGLGLEVVVVEGDGGGLTDAAALRAAVDGETAAVALQQPAFTGGLEDMAAAAAVAHEAGALFIAVVDPLSLGVLAPPGEYGADVAIGEGQSLGGHQAFGGPGFGFIAVRRELIRRLPGRIAGETVDADGKRGFVLTLQTREQHIRRENATSNICSNHMLNALAGLIYLSWLGCEGLPALGMHLARAADYARGRLLELPGVEPYTRAPVFREFAVRLPAPAAPVIARLARRGYLAGLDLGRFWPELDDVLLVAVGERRTRAEIDGFAEALGEELAGAPTSAGDGGDRA